MKNYYAILDIPFMASSDQIKKAFRLKAVKYHPDKHYNDNFFAEKFIEIKEAFDTLSDSTKKADYDFYYKKKFHIEDSIEDIQEEIRDEKKRDEEFRYNPYKPFYSVYDREQQETPLNYPTQTPWGDTIKEGKIFFTLPKRIGKLIGGYTTLSDLDKKLSVFSLFIEVIKISKKSLSITFGIVFLLYLNWHFNLKLPNALPNSFLCFITVSGAIILLKMYLASSAVKFEHVNFFIGINGFAYFKCKSNTENIIENIEVNYSDVTDFISNIVIRKRNFQYFETAYDFIWLNSKQLKTLHYSSGTHSSERGTPEKSWHPTFWLNKEAEKFWTVYLLDNMENVLDEKGYIEFNLYSFDSHSFSPYIRISVGSITFLNEDESFTYKFNEIKRIYTKGLDLYIEHLNFEKKLFFLKSGNQDIIPLNMLCNRQFFYKAMELLLGYKIA